MAAGVPSTTGAAAAAVVTATAALGPAAAATVGAGARDEADAMGVRRHCFLLLLLQSLFASPGCTSNALTWRSTMLGGCRGSCRGCSPRLRVWEGCEQERPLPSEEGRSTCLGAYSSTCSAVP